MLKPLEGAIPTTMFCIPSIITSTFPNQTLLSPAHSITREPAPFLSWSPSSFQNPFSNRPLSRANELSGHDIATAAPHTQTAEPTAIQTTTPADHGLIHLNFSAGAHWSDGAFLIGLLACYEIAKYFVFRGQLNAVLPPTPPKISLEGLSLTPAETAFLQEYAAMPSRFPVVAGLWNPVTYQRRLQKLLQQFLAPTPVLSDDFFEATVRIAMRYVDRHPRHLEHLRDSYVSCAFQQLAELVDTPRIVGDPRFTRTLERISEVAWNPALNFTPFIEGHYSNEQLKPGFDISFATTVANWCSYRDLWNGKFGYHLFTHAAHAIAILSQTAPHETFEARITLLRNCWRNQDADLFTRDRIIKTFEDDPTRVRLPAIAEESPKDANLQQIIRDILARYPLKTTETDSSPEPVTANPVVTDKNVQPAASKETATSAPQSQQKGNGKPYELLS